MHVLVEIVFWLTGVLIFYGTGEIIRSVFTLGGRKPQFKRPFEESGYKAGLFTELSYWLGILFWVSVLVIFLVLKEKGDPMAKASGVMPIAYAYDRNQEDGTPAIRVVASSDARSTCDKLYHPLWSFLIKVSPVNLKAPLNLEVGGKSEGAEANWFLEKNSDLILGGGTLSIEPAANGLSGSFDLDAGPVGKNYGNVRGSFVATWCQ